MERWDAGALGRWVAGALGPRAAMVRWDAGALGPGAAMVPLLSRDHACGGIDAVARATASAPSRSLPARPGSDGPAPGGLMKLWGE